MQDVFKDEAELVSNETTSTRADEAQMEHMKTQQPHLHAPYLVLGPWARLCVSLCVSLYVSLCELLLLHWGAAYNHHLCFNTHRHLMVSQL